MTTFIYLGEALAGLLVVYIFANAVLSWQERRDARRSLMSDAARQHKLEQDIGFFGGRQ